MVSGKKLAEKFRIRIEKRISEVEEPLDCKNGCLWCYRPRQSGSLFCCKEHQQLYEFHNGKPKKVEVEN